MLCKKKSLLNRCECEQQQLNLVILHEQIDNHYIHNHHDDPVDSIERKTWMINGVLQKPRLEQSWGSTRSGNFQPSTKLTLPGRGPPRNKDKNYIFGS
jgi:hypothetical protein